LNLKIYLAYIEMPHKNAVTHALTWRKKNKEHYNEYQKLLSRKIREFEKCSRTFRKIDINYFIY
jgi:hypothetical protein